MSDSLPRPDRKLSIFTGSELLLDYIEGQLDNDRKKSIEASLEKQKDLQIKKQNIEEALIFCESLKEIKLKQSYLIRVDENRGKIAGLIHKLSWSSWPDSLKWSSEAFLISCFVAAVFFLVPWQKFDQLRNYVRTQLVASHTKALPEVPPLPEQEVLVAAVTSSNEKKQAVEIKPVQIKPTAVPTLVPTVAPTLVPTPVPTATPTVAPTLVPTQVPKKPEDTLVVATASTQEETQSVKAKPEPSYLHRINMRVYDIKNLTPELIERLEILGVEKAGEVELGWRKPNGNYFHFTVPEENYNELVRTFSQYGPVRVYKNTHPRVLKDGFLRFIVWMEDGVKPEPTTSEKTKTDEDSGNVDDGLMNEE